jgi:hypothetical protein
MKYQLVWGYREFYSLDETVIKESTKLEMLESAQNLLGKMDDEDISKLLGVDQDIINEGIYFRIKTI